MVGTSPITTDAFRKAGIVSSATMPNPHNTSNLSRARRADPRARDPERGEGAEHDEHTHEAELLGDQRQHEIRVGFGQVVELLAAVAEALADPAALAEGEVGLDELPAGAERVAKGIEESRHAAHRVRVEEDVDADQHDRPRIPAARTGATACRR